MYAVSEANVSDERDSALAKGDGVAGKHWTDQAVHPSHCWQRDGHCVGCMMHRDWPGAREKCTLRAKIPPRKARSLEEIEDG